MVFISSRFMVSRVGIRLMVGVSVGVSVSSRCSSRFMVENEVAVYRDDKLVRMIGKAGGAKARANLRIGARHHRKHSCPQPCPHKG